MNPLDSWIARAREFARQDIRQRMPEHHYFHHLEHVEQVAEAAGQLAGAAGLDARESAILEIAAWFHDLGYANGAAGHEERSAALARSVMEPLGIGEDMLTRIENCILATRMPQRPADRLEALMADADLSHLGTPGYWNFIGKLRQELREVHGKTMNDEEWLRFEVDFMENHAYHTPEAQALYGRQKRKHLKKLQTMLALHQPGNLQAEEEETLLDGQKLGRGVETMFRSAYRTHINLSSIADNKANIMLSINAIIISITVSTLVPRFGEHPALILPTILLLIVCLGAIVFATLSTMPKVTTGTVTRDAVRKREANLIFFGNFFNMPLEDYQWGMNELIGDKRFIYNTMTRDLYFLGKVLARKYALLRWCYLVFMWGLIASVAAFALTFLTGEPS